MRKRKFEIQQLNKRGGGYYRLMSPPQTWTERFKEFATRVIRFPYSVYQTIIGRLLSYLVINPVFRKDEQDDSSIVQHKKFPDPLFFQLDEMLVLNVYPKQHLLTRIILNWHNFIVNHMMTAGVVDSFFSKILGWLPRGSHYLDQYLDQLVDKVEIKLKQDQDNIFEPYQVHFRGLEFLSPKQQDTFFEKLKQRLGYNFQENRQLYFYTLQTTDNARLDSVEVRPDAFVDQEISNRRFIVTCMPRTINYIDWLKHYKIYARETNATVIAYNYRGIGLSRGVVTNQESLYTDAYEQVQRLLALGAKPENIAMLGECLGANIATHTVGSLQEEGLPVKLFNARSFRSFTSLLKGHTLPSTDLPIWHPKTWLGWFAYALVCCVLNPIIWSAGWSLNVDEKFTAIPPHDRDFIVVRSNKDQNGKRFADDLMVPHKHASTYSLVKEKTKSIQKKKESGVPLSWVEEEWLLDVPRYHKFYVSESLHHNAKKENGHIVHPRLLVTTKVSDENPRTDARQYTINFFNRVWSKAKDLPDLKMASPA